MKLTESMQCEGEVLLPLVSVDGEEDECILWYANTGWVRIDK